MAALGPQAVSSPTHEFVDDRLCAECHAELFESYQRVGMGRSFTSEPAQEIIADIENSHYYHPASDRHYEMLLKDGQLMQRRYQVDASGERYNTLEVKVDAIIGSGNHIQSFVYRTPNGEMYQLPLAWYSKARRWRLNPGYDLPHHFGFHRRITRECMFCHNAYPLQVAAGSDAYWMPEVFPDALPEGIGCQRCHGPGQEHMRVATDSSATAAQVRTSIVNPARLEPKLAQDVCLQCHLQPSSQILSELVRSERAAYDYRPGQSLDAYRALMDFESPDEQERFEINHHAYRLHQSPCFIESAGNLSCTSCHDPHHQVAVEARLAHYRSACVSCHAVQECAPAVELETDNEDTLADCAECHMPQRRTDDVIHAVMTDHRIVRRAEKAEVRLAPKSELPPLPADTHIAAYTAHGLDPHAEQLDVYAAIAGSAVDHSRSLDRLQAYVDAAGDAVALQPLAELAAAYQRRGDLQRELEIRHRTVKLFPDHVQANLEMGMVLSAAEQPDAALNFYRRSLQIGPELPEAHLGIGMSNLYQNQVQLAEEHFRKALEMRPLYPEALLNLGIVMFAQQQWEEARELLLRARASNPAFIEVDDYLSRIPRGHSESTTN